MRRAEEQRGAQDEKRSSEEQRGTQRGEHQVRPVRDDEQNASKTKGPGGGAVQLAHDAAQQNPGRHEAASHAARVTTNVNINVCECRRRIPRSVHVEVFPEDMSWK